MTLIEIDDDLWRAQDPSAARLRPRHRRWLWCAVLGALLLAVAPPMLARAGAFRPQLRSAEVGWDGDFVEPDGRREPALTGNSPSSDVTGTVGITNTGWVTLRILGVSVAGPGFRLDHAAARPVESDGDDSSAPGWPGGTGSLAVLAPGRTALVTLSFHITDCHAVAPAPRDMTVRVESWRGVQAVTVALPTLHHDRGGWFITDPGDPQGISSIRYLADASCGVDMGA